MDNKRMNYRDGGEIGMFNLLPFELCIQILSLLPVKSLLVLRAVCKWLIAIIDDPEFASFHLRHFPDNVLETRFFFSHGIYNVDTPKKFDVAVSYMISSSNHQPVYTDHVYDMEGEFWPFEYSLDGLVLLVGRNRFPLEDNTVLWNPSIRRHRRLPLPLPMSFNLEFEFALGYHASGNDYKVVAVSYDDDVAWVYSVKSGSWTSILNFHTSNSASTCLNHDDLLSFKDGVVWIKEGGSSDEPSRELSCVWLEFGTERFCCADDLAEIKQAFCGLVALDGGSTVGLWGYDLEDQPSIWALQTHTKSWIKRHKIISPESMQLRLGSIYNTSVVERNGKLVWKVRMNEGAEAVSNHPGVVIRGVYIESLFMLL